MADLIDQAQMAVAHFQRRRNCDCHRAAVGNPKPVSACGPRTEEMPGRTKEVRRQRFEGKKEGT